MLVGVFRHIFTMSNFQSALVQFAYYGAYFSLAIPAAMINKRFGYKTGVLTGLGLAAVGGLLFIPASDLLEYRPFLVALFVLAAGMSILETSANPFVIAMGPEESATQRLNLAQAFNPVGANIGVLLGAVLILPQITSEEDKEGMTRAAARQAQEHDLSLVLGPYLGIAAVLVLIWLLIAFRKMETPAEQHSEFELEEGRSGAFGRLWGNRHYRYGVGAQFFNVAAQVCAWSFTIQYAPGRRRHRQGQRRLLPAGEPDPVPPLALRDDLPARDLPPDQAAARHGRARGGVLPDRRARRPTWSA